MKGLRLIATGGALPGRTVTNEELSRTVDTSDEWITTRTGIRARHWCTEEESAATLAIGMALSGTAQNFAGGVMILLMKPYRVGDFISAQGQSGTVREIKLFSTVITTGDNQTIYIPNNSIATAIIDNYSTSETRRVDWTIGISYGDDVDGARRALLDLLAADSRVLTDPAPVVWVAALADSSVNLSVRAWVKNADYWDVFFENNEKIYKLLPLKGISFPFPQMDVHVKQN